MEQYYQLMPYMLPNLTAYYRSDSLISPIGGPVSNWGDLLNHSPSFAQGTGANQPSYTAGPPAYLTFDGATKFLQGGNYTTPGGLAVQNLTVAGKFQLASTPGASTTTTLFMLSAGASGNFFLDLCNQAGLLPYTYGQNASTTRAAVGTNVALDTNLHSFVFSYNGGNASSTGSYQFWLDGVSQTVSATGNITVAASTPSTIGCYNAGGGGASQFFNGNIKNLIVFGSHPGAVSFSGFSTAQLAALAAWEMVI